MTGVTPEPEPWTLDPKLDVVFAFLFGAERNRRLLVALLECVLRPPVPIAVVALLPSRPDVAAAEEKPVFLDLRVRLANGEYVDVEMQTRRHPELRERVLFYWGRMYTGQLQRGQPYSGLKRCVVVLIADFVELDDPEFHSIFEVRERRRGRLFSEELELHLVELPKLRGALDDPDEPELAAWCRFFNAKTDEQRQALAMQHPILQEAKDALDDLSGDAEMRERAVRRELELQIFDHDKRLARREGLAEGRQEGLAEGRQEGLAEGRQEGLAEGRQEGLVEGRQEGLVEGRQEGLAEGAVRKAHGMLTQLLTRKFGPLPDAVRERLASASEAELDRWYERALAAESLAGTFE